MIWKICMFDQLTTLEVYELLKLRQEVFILEQACFYPDIDDKDQASFHVLGYKDGRLVACARILPRGLSFEEWSIGRVLTHGSVRKTGAGKALMKQTMDYLTQTLMVESVRISAQSYLKVFYENWGFKQVSEAYLEDDIWHMQMLWQRQGT